MPSEFRGNKVNGLSNALYEKLQKSIKDDALDSDACFEFLVNDANYNLTRQIKRYNIEAMSNIIEAGGGNMLVSIPAKAYDKTSSSWANDTMMVYMTVPVLLRSVVGTSGSAYIYIMIGKYVYDATISIEIDPNTGSHYTKVENDCWYVITFDT